MTGSALFSPLRAGLLAASFLGANHSSQAEERVPYVDLHTVLVVDKSTSVSPEELKLIMQGYAHALVYDPEIKEQLDRGVSHAFSLIFFANEARHTVTEVIKDHDHLVVFAQQNLWDFERNIMGSTPSITDGTQVVTAYKALDELFTREGEYGFKSISRAVVVSGDGNEATMSQSIRGWTAELAQKHNAIINAVPIMTDARSAVYDFYNNCIRTPEESYYQATDKMKVPVRPGFIAAGTSVEAFSTVLSYALKMNLF